MSENSISHRLTKDEYYCGQYDGLSTDDFKIKLSVSYNSSNSSQYDIDDIWNCFY